MRNPREILKSYEILGLPSAVPRTHGGHCAFHGEQGTASPAASRRSGVGPWAAWPWPPLPSGAGGAATKEVLVFSRISLAFHRIPKDFMISYQFY